MGIIYQIDRFGRKKEIFRAEDYATLEGFLKLGDHFFQVGNGNQMTVLTLGNISKGQHQLLQVIHVNNDRACNGTKKLSFYLPDVYVSHAKKKYIGELFEYHKIRPELSNKNVQMAIIDKIKKGYL